MSANAREQAAKLRAKYARVFNVPVESVVVRETEDDTFVSCPAQPDLPQWSTGNLENDNVHVPRIGPGWMSQT